MWNMIYIISQHAAQNIDLQMHFHYVKHFKINEFCKIKMDQ